MQETTPDGTGAKLVRTKRRGLMGGLGLATLGGLAAAHTAAPAAAQSEGLLTDANILNFALNLEYLEAEFYVRAAFGRGLSDADVDGRGRLGQALGGSRVPFQTPAIQQYAEEIANDEEAHVRFLRAALGDARVARPALDLNASFTAAARAAGVIGEGQVFNPFADENSFLLGAYIFEDVGVTAYKGAARFIQNKDFLEASAGILAVEAYHAAIIRTTLYARGLTDPANKISDARDSLDGPDDLDQGILVDGKANLVPTDANSIVFSRTPSQVLNIVYLGGAAANFGFFPQRLNGALR